MATESKLTPLQQELLTRADSVFDSIASAAKTVGSELVDVAVQYVHYGMAYNTCLVLFAAMLMYLG